MRLVDQMGRYHLDSKGSRSQQEPDYPFCFVAHREKKGKYKTPILCRLTLLY